MKKNLKKRLSHRMKAGFTLIELLVVIAIIGILAAVILASLDSARAKGVDAANKEDLDNARAQAELYYDTGDGTSSNTYLSVCSTAQSANGGDGGILTLLTQAATAGGFGTAPVTTASTAGTASTVICHDSQAAWAAAVPLKSVTGTGGAVQYYCVDSTGDAKIDGNTLAATGAGQFVCQ